MVLVNFSTHLAYADSFAVSQPKQNPYAETVGCMVHARSYFEKAKDNDKERAMCFLDQILPLFDLEKKLKEENATDQLIVQSRLEIAVPVLDYLHQWLKANRNNVVPQSPIGKAIA
ncbi:MAG: transposase [Flavobacterium sp.]|nr:transposase [Pedobacter sp.]